MAEPAQPPTVTAVVLAYGDQPLLVRAVDAVLASDGVTADVVLVDNGGTPDVVAALAERPGVTVVSPRRNLGFAAGSNLGAREATGSWVAFVNGDVVVRPDTLARLVGALERHDAGRSPGLATASVRLLSDPATINSAGNPVHFLGLSWAGGLDRPASEYAEARTVASASGATTVVSRELFASVGGFCETLFTYVEDTDLSLRLWNRGHEVVYVPDAVSLHDYEFSRNPDKFYLLERNRLFMVLTLFPGRVLALVGPVLVAVELAVLARATADGWGRAKLRGWWWLLRHARLIRRRRAEEQAARRITARQFADLLTSTFDPGIPGLAPPRPAQAMLDGYWALVRRAC